MFRFTDWPIRRKLGFLTGVGAAVALLFACAAFTIHDVRMIRAAKVTQITALADILGSNATTALEFDDPETAEDVLFSLRLQPSVEAAALFDTQGKLLASYPADPSAEQLAQTCPAAMDANFTGEGYLVIAKNIYRDGDHVGTVFLRSNLNEVGMQLVSLGWIAFAVMTVSLGVSMLITGRLQWLFTAPIHELAEAMELISAGGDSSLRVKKHGSDEMGVLCDGFNTMLDRVKFAHDGLQRAHNVLEERVAERTEELQGEINERKQAEEALQEARDFLEAAVAQSPSGILIADAPNVTIRLANQAAFEMRGGTRRILTDFEVAQHAKKWQTYRPDGSPYPPEQLPLSRAVLQGETVQDEEVIIRDEDGNDHWVNASAAPIRDAQGRVTAGIVLFNDITRQKQTEAELASARDAAEAANQSKSEFLANMSHEIRTPMTAILGFAELILGNVSEPENVDGIKTIQRNGEYLLEIINDILDISKIESGKLKVERIACSPFEVLADVASLMRVRSSVKGLPLEVAYDGPIPQFIQTDPTRLRQILINLIGNAIKFTEVGKIRLEARLLDADSDGPRMQFRIVDSGIGMTERQIVKAFQPFVQADTSTTRKFGGTGLGLTISRRLAEMLGGNVSIQSTLGKGSVFSVTVSAGPLEGVTMIEDATEVETRPRPSEKPAGQDVPLECRILLAEDGPDNQRLISFLLTKAGAHVTVAADGQIALDLALAARDEGMPFDVILMDMQMPVLDGYGSTSQLRKAGYTGPIIALTAHAMDSDRVKCLNAGCDDFATKPINRAKLFAMIRKHISIGENPARLPHSLV